MTFSIYTLVAVLDVGTLKLKRFAICFLLLFLLIIFLGHLQNFMNCIYLCLVDADFFIDSRSSPYRATSMPPPAISIPPRSYSVPPRDVRATSVPRFDPLSPLDILSEYEREPFQRGLSPTPVRAGRWGPRSSEVAFDSDGNWIFFLQYRSINLWHLWHILFCSKAL